MAGCSIIYLRETAGYFKELSNVILFKFFSLHLKISPKINTQSLHNPDYASDCMDRFSCKISFWIDLQFVNFSLPWRFLKILNIGSANVCTFEFCCIILLHESNPFEFLALVSMDLNLHGIMELTTAQPCKLSISIPAKWPNL